MIALPESSPSIGCPIPQELRDRRQWVVWRREAREGGVAKVLYDPWSWKQRASTRDSTTWGSFQNAAACSLDWGFDGIGFVFTPDDPYVGVDLDHCRNPETGEIEPRFLEMIRTLDSYTELSPSGTGLHVIVRGKLPEGWRRHGGVEMYDLGRYFTMTAEPLPGARLTVEERTAELAELHALLVPPQAVRRARVQSEPRGAATLSLSDQEVLTRATVARNGERFGRLWEGRWIELGYESQSNGDLALCNLLAFWTARNAAQMDRMFRVSGLYRPKWDEQHGEQTYGEMTIAQAIDGTDAVYEVRQRSTPKGPSVEERASQVGDRTRAAFVVHALRRFLTEGERGIVVVVGAEDLGVADEALKEVAIECAQRTRGGMAVFGGRPPAFGAWFLDEVAHGVIEPKQRLTFKPHAIHAAQRRHRSTYKAVCQHCDFGPRGDGTCPFYAQQRGTHAVRLYPHVFLGTDWHKGSGRVVITPDDPPTSGTSYLVAELYEAADSDEFADVGPGVRAILDHLHELAKGDEVGRLTVEAATLRPIFEAATKGLLWFSHGDAYLDLQEPWERPTTSPEGLIGALRQQGARVTLDLTRKDHALEVSGPLNIHDCLRRQRVVLLGADECWIEELNRAGLKCIPLESLIDKRLSEATAWAQTTAASVDGGLDVDVSFDSAGVAVGLYDAVAGTEVGSLRIGNRAAQTRGKGTSSGRHRLVCQMCQQEFTAKRSDAQHCSDACRKAAQRKVVKLLPLEEVA